MPEHHPDTEDLIEYASGAADEWLAVMVACHLTLCPRCRDEVALLDEVGGALLGASEGTPIAFTAPPDAATSAGNEVSRTAPATPLALPAELASVPRPLHPFLAETQPRFRWLAPGVTHVPLTLEANDRPLRLLRFKKGFTIPEHGHGGLEWLMVLDGELSDDSDGQSYGRGDVCRNEPGKVHVQRVGANDDCIALVANLGPLIPQNVIGRVLARIVGI